MEKINFPDPIDFPNGWFDEPNNQWWDHDGDGWIARSSSTGGGGDLPPVPPPDADPNKRGNPVLTAQDGTQTLSWENFNQGRFY